MGGIHVCMCIFIALPEYGDLTHLVLFLVLSTVQEEGFFSLWKGCSPAVLRHYGEQSACLVYYRARKLLLLPVVALSRLTQQKLNGTGRCDCVCFNRYNYQLTCYIS